MKHFRMQTWTLSSLFCLNLQRVRYICPTRNDALLWCLTQCASTCGQMLQNSYVQLKPLMTSTPWLSNTALDTVVAFLTGVKWYASTVLSCRLMLKSQFCWYAVHSYAANVWHWPPRCQYPGEWAGCAWAPHWDAAALLVLKSAATPCLCSIGHSAQCHQMPSRQNVVKETPTGACSEDDLWISEEPTVYSMYSRFLHKILDSEKYRVSHNDIPGRAHQYRLQSKPPQGYPLGRMSTLRNRMCLDNNVHSHTWFALAWLFHSRHTAQNSTYNSLPVDWVDTCKHYGLSLHSCGCTWVSTVSACWPPELLRGYIYYMTEHPTRSCA